MKFTMWTLALLALVGAIYFVRAKMGHRKDRQVRAQRAVRSKESRAEADRRDILELMKKLDASNPDNTPSAEPKADSPARRPAERERARPREQRSVQSPHGYDPDLPDPRARSGRS